MAGIVTPTPKAMDSPAEPAVWTMLFSRMLASFMPSFFASRNSVIEMTATGIEALTVSPTLSTRYSDEAPNTMPRSVPSSTERTENSGRLLGAGMYEANGAHQITSLVRQRMIVAAGHVPLRTRTDNPIGPSSFPVIPTAA